MSEINLEALGITTEELRSRVVERCVEQLLRSECMDEDGEGVEVPSGLSRSLHEAVRERIDEAVEKIADREVRPSVERYIEGFTLQRTNEWGEKSGKEMTFTEYLVDRAERYMQEPVDMDGKAKGGLLGQRDQTRLTYMIDRHLQFRIESAVKNLLNGANKQLAEALEETLRAKVRTVAETFKVNAGVR